MLARLKRILLVLLVGILPLQSAAAALLPVVCAPQEASHAAAAAHGGHGHAAHVHDEAAPQPGGGAAPDQGADGHLCCHQVSSGTPFVHVLPAENDFRVYAATVPLLTPLHIPELPQRPPRS